jgi:hypothetical protein
MGMSPDAHLFYGYDLGEDGKWEIAGIGAYQPWIPSWLEVPDPDAFGENDQVDYCELVQQRLLATVGGFTDDRPDAANWSLFDHWRNTRDTAKAAIGVELVNLGSYDIARYALVAHHIRAGYEFKPVGPADLVLEATWDVRLADALTALDIQPVGERGWFLSASYG